jgi:nucleotide-binding universal stress UspA family protein
MKPKRILLPLDIRKCPLEAFSVVNDLAKHPGATVILLHVVTLNIAAPEKRVYEDLSREASWYLARLARQHVLSPTSTLIHVRFGKPADEILAEAKAEKADVILLPTFGGLPWKRGASFWKRLIAPIFPGIIVEKLARSAPCALFCMHADSRFNCEKVWGRPGNEINTPLGHLHEALRTRTSPVLLTEDAFASAQEDHRAAAQPPRRNALHTACTCIS